MQETEDAMARSTLLLAVLSLAAVPAAAQEEFDPRRLPTDRELQKQCTEVKRAWKRARPEERASLLDQLAEYDHDLTLRTLVDLCRRADPATCLHGISLLTMFHDFYLARHLPRLLAARQRDLETFRACVQVAMDRQIHECLPTIREVAREPVAAPASTRDPQAARSDAEQTVRTRTLCIKALGVIQHEDNLPVLLAIMRSYASLEGASVEHGNSGDMNWSRFYIPARTAFCLITRSGAETAAQAASWLAEHRDFAVPRPERVDPRQDQED
jgi:hypothetical protein